MHERRRSRSVRTFGRPKGQRDGAAFALRRRSQHRLRGRLVVGVRVTLAHVIRGAARRAQLHEFVANVRVEEAVHDRIGNGRTHRGEMAHRQYQVEGFGRPRRFFARRK